MPALLVPFHQDERLPDGALPLPGDTLTPDLPDGDLWRRRNTLYDGVAGEVARRIDAGERPTVVSGDCLMALPVLAGAQRAGAGPSVIWFDAHGDVHTLGSSTSVTSAAWPCGSRSARRRKRWGWTCGR